jgi:C4-dicarboxylate-specific signal transduction histidine kinase
MKLKVGLLLFLLLLIGIIVTLNIFFQQNYQAEMADQFNHQQLLIAKTVASSIHGSIEHIEEELIALSRLLADRGLGEKGFGRFIKSAFAEIEEEIGIDLVVVNGEEKIVFRSQGKSDNWTAELRRLIKTGRKLGKGNAYFHEDITSLRKIWIIVPIYKEDDWMGCLIAAISLDDLSKKYLSPIKSGKRGYAWMIDSSGTLLYHPTQPDMIGKNIYNADETCFGCHKSFKAEKQILGAPEVGFQSYVAPQGEDKLVAFSRVKIAQLDWIVCVSIPYSEVTASIANSMRLHSLLLLSVFIATFVAAFVIIMINRQRIKAEEKAIYSDKIREYATELENIVQERTKELGSEKEKLNAIVSSIEAGLAIVDGDGRLVWINRVFNEWLSEEKRGFLTIGNLFTDGQNDSLVEMVIDNQFIREVSYHDFGRKRGYFQIVARPIHPPEGEPQILLLLQDVTEIKKAEEQLMQSEKLTALARLSAGVAHEIGNPLTSISSYVQILKEMDQDEFTKESLETISRHIGRIGTIVRQMSNFAKIQAENLGTHKVSDLIKTTVDLVRYDKRTSMVRIHTDINGDLPDIRVDGNQIVQVFVNLILNAADAMPGGGDLRITAAKLNGMVEIVFSDTGHGIEKENLDRIFDPFFTTKDRGTGLGLAVSYTIIKSFGGDILVESTPGRGTTFRVRLSSHG